MAKPALGRGLGALLSGMPAAPKSATAPTNTTTASILVSGADNRERVQRVPLRHVRPCPFQPRKDFSTEALQELADSIREKGIVQPLLVRNKGDHFELIAGERRWRAAQLLNLAEVPVIVREADDRTVLELALIENLQRENLNALEEALGYSQLIEQFKLTQEEAAAKVGKSRAVVANALRLLKLPAQVQEYVRSGRLSVGHAKVILGLTLADEQALAADRIIRDALNVRQTEELVSAWQKRSPLAPSTRGGKAAPYTRDTHVAAVENKLTERLGTKVSLRYRQGKGSVEVKFFNDDDLDRILQIMGVTLD